MSIEKKDFNRRNLLSYMFDTDPILSKDDIVRGAGELMVVGLRVRCRLCGTTVETSWKDPSIKPCRDAECPIRKAPLYT